MGDWYRCCADQLHLGGREGGREEGRREGGREGGEGGRKGGGREGGREGGRREGGEEGRDRKEGENYLLLIIYTHTHPHTPTHTHSPHSVVIEVINERDEPSSLSAAVEGELRDVLDKECGEVTTQLQIVCST